MGIQIDTMDLNSDFVWLDEFSWNNVKSNIKYTLGGTPVITESTVSSGRPMTIGGDNAWLTRANLDILYTWSNQLGKQMILTLADGIEYSVIFRHYEPPVIEAASPIGYSKPEDDFLYTATLKFAEYMVE